MNPRDTERLAGVHPYMIQSIGRILDAMRGLGFPMFVVSGVRTTKEQVALYAQGRTTNGKIVTNLDGVTKRSNHQPNVVTNLGHAVDCAFVDDPKTVAVETWDANRPWAVYGTMGEALGLRWGGRWKSPYDPPHLELPADSPYA